MTTAPSTDLQSPAVHPHHTPDLLRDIGARQNNLDAESVYITKRRLTVFTGVLDSGNRALVFNTNDAEAQQMNNET